MLELSASLKDALFNEIITKYFSYNPVIKAKKGPLKNETFKLYNGITEINSISNTYF